MKQKILFITCDRVKDTYGITSGLFNSARFVVNFLSDKYDSKLIPVTDSNQIDKVVTEFNADIVVIEALWVPPAKFDELLKIERHKNRKWIVRIHSKAPFLANEGVALKWIEEYTRIKGVIIAPNTRELTRQLKISFRGGEFIYLPNVYEFHEFEEKDKTDSSTIDIGCFGAIRPMKNTFQQALAAIEFAESKGKVLNFHINSSRIEQSGDNVVRNLRAIFEYSHHNLIEHTWYNHKELLSVIATLDIGTQVSFSESFNIVTADFVTAGVPIVAGEDITWMPWFLKAKPTSHFEIVRKMKFAYKYRKLCRFTQRLFLEMYNKLAKYIWLITINN